MLLLRTDRIHAHGLVLIFLRQRLDPAGHGGGKHQGAPRGRGRIQDEFQFLPEAEIEHLIGFIQHNSAQAFQHQGAAPNVIGQTPRRAHDDMGAALQRPALIARIHSAHARCHDRA